MTIGRWAWNSAKQKKSNLPQPIGGSLVVNLTTRCNFSCKHCMRDLGNPKDFSFDLLRKLIGEAKKFRFRHMSLTGGEPLLYPQLDALIDLLGENGFLFNIATNGFLLKDFSQHLRKNKNNIHFLQFSLEDTDEKKHDFQRRAGSFQKLLEGVDFCRSNKIPFRFMTAVSTANIDTIFDIALFAKKKGAFSLAATTVLPCPRSENNRLVLSEESRGELFASLFELSRLLKFPITPTAAIRTCGSIRFCSGLSLNEIAFDIDGNAVQCCDLANFDDDALRTRTTIAPLKDKTFGEILLLCSDHISQCSKKRIKDYSHEPDPDTPNFNSCFYCLRSAKSAP
jgi:MoaA/NifB/PqqE/SkfB family radical SAM enzyme